MPTLSRRIGRPRRSLKRRQWVMLALAVLVAVGASIVALAPPLNVMTLASASMEPTLHCAFGPRCRALHPDRVVVLARRYDWRGVRAGDVVVVSGTASRGDCEGDSFVKRVVATSGDTVRVGHHLVVVTDPDNRVLLRRGWTGASSRPSLVRLNAGQVYVVGDNISFSCDSRVFGAVDVSFVEGRVLARVRGSYFHVESLRR